MGVAHWRGDGPCDDCGGPNVIWHTDDLLWNRVIRDHGDECILCVHCFVARAEKFYKVGAWRLTIAPEMIERKGVSPPMSTPVEPDPQPEDPDTPDD